MNLGFAAEYFAISMEMSLFARAKDRQGSMPPCSALHELCDSRTRLQILDLAMGSKR